MAQPVGVDDLLNGSMRGRPRLTLRIVKVLRPLLDCGGGELVELLGCRLAFELARQEANLEVPVYVVGGAEEFAVGDGEE